MSWIFYLVSFFPAKFNTITLLDGVTLKAIFCCGLENVPLFAKTA